MQRSQYPSNLKAIIPKTMDKDKIKSDAWKQQKILVVNLEESQLDWAHKQMALELGHFIYGG